MRMPAFLFVLAVAATGFGIATLRAQQTAHGNAQPDTQGSSNSVHKIALPEYPPELPAGPGKETFLNNCLICHSARYVTMQPFFTKPVWQAEVQKMITAYGAAISPADKETIVDYLVSFHGAKVSAAPGPGQGSPAPK